MIRTTETDDGETFDFMAIDFGNERYSSTADYNQRYYPNGAPACAIPAWANGKHTATLEFESGEAPLTVTVPNTELPAGMTAAESAVYYNTVFWPNAATYLLKAIRARFVRDGNGEPRLEAADDTD